MGFALKIAFLILPALQAKCSFYSVNGETQCVQVKKITECSVIMGPASRPQLVKVFSPSPFGGSLLPLGYPELLYSYLTTRPF